MKDHMTERNIDAYENLESTRAAVEEIIAGEEVDRSTPAEVIAGINAAMKEIESLRELTQTQATHIFELLARIDSMREIAESNLENITNAVNDVIITAGRATFDNLENRNKLDIIHRLARAVAGQKWWVERIRQASTGQSVAVVSEPDEITF